VCISDEAPRNHLILPQVLGQLASPSADGKGEPAPGHQDERRGHCQWGSLSAASAGYLGTFTSCRRITTIPSSSVLGAEGFILRCYLLKLQNPYFSIIVLFFFFLRELIPL